MPRTCPVCKTRHEKATVFIEENIDPDKLSTVSFASRKEPERMSHRMVQCPVCDLVYVDQPPHETELAHAYHVADYDSSEEANDAALAYLEAARPTLEALPQRMSTLEIGTGTGAFLELLSRSGFNDLVGVEPSPAAIAAAPLSRRAWIRNTMFNENDFMPESFDLICCLGTLEHVLDPDMIANASFRLLRPGGAFITVTHDYRSLVNRLLGKRSPIVDIEHMQLFSRRGVRYLLENAGYSDVTAKPFRNTYSLRYWLRLTPLPRGIKGAATSVAGRLGLERIKLGINVGNVFAAGFKR